MAARPYPEMARKLEIVRRRLDKPLTLADKVLPSHLDNPDDQELIPGSSYLKLRPDRVVFQDALGQTAILITGCA
jgi:aconitate hydratase